MPPVCSRGKLSAEMMEGPKKKKREARERGAGGWGGEAVRTGG